MQSVKTADEQRHRPLGEQADGEYGQTSGGQTGIQPIKTARTQDDSDHLGAQDIKQH